MRYLLVSGSLTYISHVCCQIWGAPCWCPCAGRRRPAEPAAALIMQRCAARVLPTTRRVMIRVVATRTVASRAAPAAIRPSFGALLPSKAHRALCTSALHPEMEELNEEFAEARYALADAEESVGTTYFADDLEDARDATEKVAAAAALGSMTPSLSSYR